MSIVVGIDQELVRTGPVLPEIVGVLGTYQRLALISVTLAMYIRMLGYSARAHSLWNYQVMYVPVAIDAGVGELSRAGIIINRELGNCLKITTVTTDMPIEHDRPVNLRVREFCEECRLCAQYCPSGAINNQACYRIWNKTGTDCGVCMAVCPWTKKVSPPHELGRRIATRGRTGARLLLPIEKAFGSPIPQEPPSWLEKPSAELLESVLRHKE